MADGGQKPVTIMVKKADGTFERKTLDEVNALKKQTPAAATIQPAQAASIITPTPAPTPAQKPAIKTVSKEALAALNESIRAEKAAKAAAAKASKVEPVAQPIVSQSKDTQTEEIISKMSFTVSSTAGNRLRTLIQLRLKDIRTPDQIHEALLRSEEDGGVGLTDQQAEEVMKQLPGWLPAPVVKSEAVKAVVPPPAPVVKPPAPKPVVPAAPPTPEAKAKAINAFIKNSPEEPYFWPKANPSPAGGWVDKLPTDSSRPMMRDITTTKPFSIGPIDEIRVFTLTDFRRLSTNPEEAAMRLKQKFMNLKDESVLLYMESLEAWKKSPLYSEYVLAAITSLSTKQPINTTKDQKTINFNEIKAIVGMEHQLVYV